MNLEHRVEPGLLIPRVSLPMAGFGVTAVVAGGILAAATASASSQPAAWATAYLVLVVGVVQIALAVGLGLLAPRPITSAMQVGVFALFNLGNAAVLAGTLLDGSSGEGGGGVWIVDSGGALLAAAMVLSLYLVHRARRSWLLAAFVSVVVVVLVSMPIGLVLARL